MRRDILEAEKQKRIEAREFMKQNPMFTADYLNTFLKSDDMVEGFYQGELEEGSKESIITKILVT
ncbi:MAG: hypothetical protein ACRDAG_12540 [Cetobacterium somerae]|uniref:hypothetical protein n=1 Tax=Cetobacterium somerae TaxID=188913 RepID=UPI003F3B57E8